MKYLKCKKIAGESGWYDVFFGNLHIGSIYYDSEAWAWNRWFIQGDPRNHNAYVSLAEFGKTKRRSGFHTRRAAVRELALKQSALIIGAQS